MTLKPGQSIESAGVRIDPHSNVKRLMFVGFQRPCNMPVCLWDRSAQAGVCAVTLRQNLQIKLSVSPSHSILTPRQPMPALSLQRQAPGRVGLLVGCLTSQQHASVSQGRISTDNFTCCHTDIEVADPTFYLTQSQYTDTGPTSPSADPITPGAWQGSHWSANV